MNLKRNERCMSYLSYHQLLHSLKNKKFSMPRSDGYFHRQLHSMQVRFIHLVLDYKHYLLIHKSSLRNVSHDLYLNENGILLHSVSQMKIMIVALIAYCLYKIMIYSVAILYAEFALMISWH